MTLPSDQYQSILSLLNNYEFEQAQEAIKLWDEQTDLSPLEEKQILHLYGINAFFKDDLQQAQELFQQARKLPGDYLEFSMDYASLLYSTNQWDLWREEYLALEDLLNSEAEIESPAAWILLSKFYEEEGLISKSLDCLQRAYNQSTEGKNRAHRSKVLAQLLRIESTFLSGKNVGGYYSQLIQVEKKRVSKEFEIEIEHALMLGELSLVGPLHASERLFSALEHEKISQLDCNLLLFDFVEECLIRNHEVPNSVRQRIQKAQTASAFEQVIQDLCSSKTNNSQMTLNRLMKMAPQISMAAYLRILTLSLKLLCNVDVELKNKLHLLLSSIDPDSRHSWTLRLDSYLKTSLKRVLYDEKSRSLKYENKAVDLSRKRGMLLFIEALAKNPNSSIEEMIQLIWESEFSPDHFHRLRMTAHRMNKVIYDLTSVEKAIEVSSDRVRVKPILVLDNGMPH